MNRKTTFFLTILLVFASPCVVEAQNIAAYSGTSTPTSNAVANASSTPLSRGSGISAGGGSNFNSTSWTTSSSLQANDYIEWSVSADADYIVNITSIVINYRRDDGGGGFFGTGSGPRDLRLRSSLDGFSANLFSDSSVSSSGSGETNTITTSLSSTTGGTITFRLYGYRALNGFFTSFRNTFQVLNGLGTVLSVADTGIRMEGSVVFDGLLYSGGSWAPSAPSASSGSDNVLIADGTYSETGNVEVNDLTINSGASVVIEKTGSIEVNGDLSTSNSLTLESDSDEFSSLMVDGSVTGNVNYERHVNSLANGNDLISAPVTGQTFGNFAAANSNIFENPSDTSQKLFGHYDKTVGDYLTYDTDVPADANTTLDPGIGYRTGSSDNSPYTFTGTVNTDDISINIINAGPPEPRDQEWNLVGNPYPAHMKVQDFLLHNVAVGVRNIDLMVAATAAIYGYDGDLNDGWKILNLATTTPSTVITPGQGFFVSADAALVAAHDLEFTPSMCTNGSTDDFIPGRLAQLTYMKLKLNKVSENSFTSFYFNPAAGLGFDLGYDAGVWEGEDPEFLIYSHLVQENQGEPIALQTLHSTDVSNVTIPLGVNAGIGEQITFSIAETTIDQNINVYLEDSYTNTSVLLNDSDYVITPTTDLNGTGRFFLRFTEDTLSTVEKTLDSIEMYALSASDEILVKGNLLPDSTLIIYDIQGRKVNQVTLDNTKLTNRISSSGLQTGAYILSLTNGNQQKTQKIVIH